MEWQKSDKKFFVKQWKNLKIAQDKENLILFSFFISIEN